MEMLHQDLRPENILIDRNNTVKIIDFGSVRVAGLVDNAAPADRAEILGTLQYTAPEYFVGEAGMPQSDLFSLGVITYQMLTGRLPYGTQVSRVRTQAAQRQLVYASALQDEQRPIPAWIDSVLKKAVHPNPLKRHEALSEFVQDLRQPGADFLNRSRAPLMERNPLLAWKLLSLLLALAVVVLLGVIRSMG
jgi:serine/threonine protein kinase